jgi:hypothetical protein
LHIDIVVVRFVIDMISKHNKEGQKMKLIKDKYYRVTEVSGKKWRGDFEEECVVLGFDCLKFSFKHQIISIDLIAKIEEASWITTDDQAREKGCWEEFLMYQTINGKTPRIRYIYNTVFEGGE